MTTGNVTQAACNAVNVAVSANVATNIISNGVDNGSSFNKVMSQMTDGDNTKDVSVKATTQTKINSNKTKDNVKSEDTKLDKEDVSKLEDSIKETVEDALDITDEELEEVMSELGITIADLLVPQNVANLIATVKDTSALTIVTDDGLSQLLSNLNNTISDLVNEFAADNNISFDYVAEALNMTEDVNTEENTQTTTEGDGEASVLTNQPETTESVQVAKVTDSETGKTIEITAVDNRVTDEKVTTVNQNTFENASEDMKDDDKSSNDSQSLAQNILNSLTESVSNTETAVSDIQDFSQVNATDIINQIVDSVKVNVSNQIQSMEIQLNPENLGKINLTVVAKDGMITASIVAQNEGVKNAIESQLTMLKEQFNNQGIKVDNVEVTVANQGFNANAENGNGGFNDNNRSNARRRFRGIDEINVDDNPVTDNEETLNEGGINLKA